MFVEEQPLKFWQRPSSERRLLLEAWGLMAIGRFAMLFLPWRWLRPRLGTFQAESGSRLTSAEMAIVQKVAEAIETSRWFTFWDSNCMARAIAAQRMLYKRGVPSTLYIGAGRSQKQQFETHAWVRCGEKIVSGEKGHHGLTILTSFATQPSSITP